MFQASVPNTWIQAQIALRFREPARPAAFTIFGYSDNYWCACGNPKDFNREACERCRDLDGHYKLTQEIIYVLRNADGPLSLNELAEATGRSTRGLLMSLQRLMKLGRLTRFFVAVRGGDHWRYGLTVRPTK